MTDAAAQWREPLGATLLADGGVEFRVWCPTRRRVELHLEAGPGAPATIAMTAARSGMFVARIESAAAATRYRYRLDEEGLFPDPASRFQPDGVHGASQVVAAQFAWTDHGWRGIDLPGLSIYELHIGTFTATGTYAAAIDKLPCLRDLGVGAIELMPVGDFPGKHNWGYDGVSLFAPARCYGSPDELRQLVDAAHGHGLGVLLDVVYNHFGPDGAYLAHFSPYYLSAEHRTPWGAALNLDGLHSEQVRELLFQNARYWLDEFHFDGLRLDATHALIDDGPNHFLQELGERLRRTSNSSKPPLLIAEDHRNLRTMIEPSERGGWGVDAVWADDFHHQVQCNLTGEHEGYYGDYSGASSDIAATIGRGWFYTGQHSLHLGEARGSNPDGLPPQHFVVCLQNHDQVGNRAFGERLHHQIDPAAFRAATTLLLCAPETPLLFMGQEWAAGTPFLFFTDHKPELGELVTKGRRQEFQSFSAFRDPQVREQIPDPQAESTFAKSQLDWSEREQAEHSAVLELHRCLLSLRRNQLGLRAQQWDSVAVRAAGEATLVLERGNGRDRIICVVQLRGANDVELRELAGEVLLSTEEPRFALDAMPILCERQGQTTWVRFARPGAILLRSA
ncbi:MAG TPA: malto-oligosyltrehalose trehalohydrolase [Terriglobales bacterium]|nr:malto-oligosyltrehalose trehalohydrolase [Terriglobales bacterium]